MDNFPAVSNKLQSMPCNVDKISNFLNRLSVGDNFQVCGNQELMRVLRQAKKSGIKLRYRQMWDLSCRVWVMEK